MRTEWSNTAAAAPEATQAIASRLSTDTAHNQSWSFKLFWTIAIPVAFGSIVAPVFGGSVYRWLATLWQRAGITRRRIILAWMLLIWGSLWL